MNKENGWDASASWNGYMYQGKVALLLTLRKINDIGDVSGYWLESEGIEDFSIGLGEEYQTIHQVKNRKDEKIEDYREALSNIVKRIKDYPNIENGYLHVKKQIKTDDWEKDIEEQLLNYYPEKIQQIKKNLENTDVMNSTYNEILEKWNEEKKRFNRNTKDICKMIISQLEKKNNFEKKADITIDLFKSATEQVYMDEKKNYDVTKTEEVIKKIELFNYLDDNSSEEAENKLFASSSEIMDMTLMEIEKYWGEIAEYRIGKNEIYYMKLLDLINYNIIDRAENKSNRIKIPFEKFKEILDTTTKDICEDTKEEALIRLKYLYMKENEEFCKVICSVISMENCENCKLKEISNIILKSSLPELETIFHIMALHQTGKLTERGFELFSKPELENSFFAGITKIDKEFFISEYKVICQIHDKFMLATTIDAESQGRKNETIKGLMNNNNIQDLCHKIINNDEYDTTLMEVDKLITRNFDTEDIFADACKIDIITENDESENDESEDDKLEDKLKYMNITRTKKVGLISVEKAKQEYGERK